MPPLDDPTLSPVKKKPPPAASSPEMENCKPVEVKLEKVKLEEPEKKESVGRTRGQMSIKDMFAAASKRKADSQGGEKPKKPKVVNKRCKICKQLVDRNFITMHQGAPNFAKDELNVLFNPENKLIIQSDNYEDKPAVNLDEYSVYDEQGHLVPLDKGLLEDGAKLYFDGYLKNLFDEGEGAPVKLCLMEQWWTSGFDGGENVIVGFSTEAADYHLKEPSEEYKPFMKDIWEQSFLVKYLIEFLEAGDAGEEEGEEDEEDGSYEKFLEYLAAVTPPRKDLDELTSETVVKHAEFLVSQIISYQQAGDSQDKNHLDSPLIKRICELAGVQRNQVKQAKNRVVVKKDKSKPKFCEATVTPLVRGVFESLFSGQMAIEGGKGRSKACGSCEQCLNPECGQCKHCKDMVKFGGSGKSKQKCKERKCPNMQEQEQGDELSADEEEAAAEKTKAEVRVKTVNDEDVDFSWVGKGTKAGTKTYYEGAKINGETVKKGDHILLESDGEDVPPYVGTVGYMFESNGTPMVHIQWFARGRDTVLGEVGDPAELFFIDSCHDEPFLSFAGVANVEIIPQPNQEEWRKLGGTVPRPWKRESDTSFFCSLWYDCEQGRFEYPAAAAAKAGLVAADHCSVCEVTAEQETRFTARVHEKRDGVVTSLLWNRTQLKVGDCIYLTPGSAKMKCKPSKLGKETVKKEGVDEDLYPEYYRKSEYVKGNNYNTPDPFIVARILQFKGEGAEVKVKVGLFYRPENTGLQTPVDDMNMLYWSQDTDWVPADSIEGICYVRCGEENYEEVSSWCDEGPDRWVFRKCYDSGAKSESGLPEEAQQFGDKLKEATIPTLPQIKKKLVSLDIFAGCGGLSKGLHDAGVAETHWAVEIYEPAAKAFKLNNKASTVFTDDCNLLLKNVIEGREYNEKKQKYPQRGEVELLVGGPPCQGFSGMNRFNAGEYSSFKNSLVASYLSYLEFYRPRYFILENVKNFANFKKSMVLKSCLRALVKMGYQCTFGIMQAGQFGIAQTRRRAILLAAAPGEVLPRYPEPQHVFSPQACHLSVEVDGKRFDSQTRWVKSAPRRTVTVRDTMSDLPKIVNGESSDVMKYGGDPTSHFQRRIRNNGTVLYDHVTKRLAPLIVKRFEFIPTTPGSDWRDLPNQVVELSDGTKTQKLLYFYDDTKNGRSSTGEKRGVCPCAAGGKCDNKDKQQNTLIPWCLPHTGNRHNHWAGLYGRVEWDGFFSTTITNPEPMGKQGRVLHPDQNRLVSVRECARSQGFPDDYRFHGTVIEKHRQIGNAVPPPLGRALGLSIGEAMVLSKQGK